MDDQLARDPDDSRAAVLHPGPRATHRGSPHHTHGAGVGMKKPTVFFSLHKATDKSQMTVSWGFLLVKILDIGFVTCLYFALGVILALIIDQPLGKFDADRVKHKHVGRLLSEIVLHMYFVGVVVYLVRNAVQTIPFPFDGMFGFRHNKLKELTSATVFTTTFVMFQRHLREKIYHVHARLAYGVHD